MKAESSNPNETSVKLNPTPTQKVVLESDTRFIALAAGRRFGKTTVCAYKILQYVLERSDAPEEKLVWWVAPYYKQTKIGMRKFKKIIPDKFILNSNLSEMRFQLVGNVVVEFKSADNYDSLRGEGVDFLIVDEAAQVKKAAWEEALRPTMTDNPDSRMIAISTPKGRNWFWELYQRGQSSEWDKYESWSFPSWKNPTISHDDIKEAKDSVPNRVYRQEYKAEFIDDAGGVFRGVKEAVDPALSYGRGGGLDPEGTGFCVAGVDLARLQDYTVITIRDVTNGEVVYFDRFSDLQWETQRKKIRSACERYDAECVIDATRDNKVVQDLEVDGVKVNSFKFTNPKKREIVENLQVELEEGGIRIPEIDILIEELQAFEYETTPAGNVKYNAPDGWTDDCVMALALSGVVGEPKKSCWGVEDASGLL